MTNQDAIKFLQQIYPNGGNCWLDEQRIEAIDMAVKALQEEPVSVWHYQKKEPVNEIADKSRPIIVVYGNNSLNAAGKFRCYEDNSDAIWLSNSYEKWAFVEDLISLSHSVTKVSWQEEPVSVWHNVQYPYDETKPVLIVAIDHTLHLWKGKFDTDKMCNAFRLFTGTDWNNKPSSIVSKWAYIDDLLKF